MSPLYDGSLIHSPVPAKPAAPVLGSTKVAIPVLVTPDTDDEVDEFGSDEGMKLKVIE